MIKDFLSGIKHFFQFSRKETIVFVSLSFFTIVMLLVPFFIELLFAQNEIVTPEDIQKLDSLVALLEKKNEIHYFDFDPNLISRDSMYLLGISPQVAHNWASYRNAGGKFRYKSDLAEVYNFDSAVFENLKDYILLPDKVAEQENSGRSKRVFDINQATQYDLKDIYGIGEKLSARIIKYRDLLGGYVNEKQYDEVYYLEGEALQNLKDQTYISKKFIPEKVNINKADFREIIRHPYIDKELTKSILNYRNAKDSYLDKEKLKSLLEDDSLYSHLLPYIEF